MKRTLFLILTDYITKICKLIISESILGEKKMETPHTWIIIFQK